MVVLCALGGVQAGCGHCTGKQSWHHGDGEGLAVQRRIGARRRSTADAPHILRCRCPEPSQRAAGAQGSTTLATSSQEKPDCGMARSGTWKRLWEFYCSSMQGRCTCGAAVGEASDASDAARPTQTNTLAGTECARVGHYCQENFAPDYFEARSHDSWLVLGFAEQFPQRSGLSIAPTPCLTVSGSGRPRILGTVIDRSAAVAVDLERANRTRGQGRLVDSLAG